MLNYVGCSWRKAQIIFTEIRYRVPKTNSIGISLPLKIYFVITTEIRVIAPEKAKYNVSGLFPILDICKRFRAAIIIREDA